MIDISRIRASDAGVALTMTCGQALVDQILTFTDHQWVRVLDECWRQIRYPHIVRRISEGQKLARGDDVTAGSATLIALHRISDLMGAAPDVRELALGLLADCSTRIIYNQADDQVPITRSTLNLTDVEAALAAPAAAGHRAVEGRATVVPRRPHRAPRRLRMGPHPNRLPDGQPQVRDRRPTPTPAMADEVRRRRTSPSS